MLVLDVTPNICEGGGFIVLTFCINISSIQNNETFEKCSILFKFKEVEDFNHRNTLSISRIKI